MRGEFYQFLADYEKHNLSHSSDSVEAPTINQERNNNNNVNINGNEWNNFPKEPILVVATETIPLNQNDHLLRNTSNPQPSSFVVVENRNNNNSLSNNSSFKISANNNNNNGKDFDIDNTSIDTSGGIDISRSDESVSSNGQYQNLELTQSMRIKAEFDNVYKDTVSLQNALGEFSSKGI